jgi:enamine deaminase RidA (YjgF/YER057c/UK114 family)
MDKTAETIESLDDEARQEFEAMRLHEVQRAGRGRIPGVDPVPGRSRISMRAITAPDVLNEAYDYSLPSSFSRGLSIELPGATMLLLSGTASVDEQGDTVHPGDFEAQCLRTFRNLTQLLVAENASWHDIVRTTCYLRDIERDYDRFNEMRTMFMTTLGLDPLPASTGIQARLCRSDLLIEIEAIAILPNG